MGVSLFFIGGAGAVYLGKHGTTEDRGMGSCEVFQLRGPVLRRRQVGRSGAGNADGTMRRGGAMDN